jgi:two-component system, chemotaxis family, sensor kinase CheA
MDKGKLIQRLMATFLDELEEHVRTLNQELLALEKGPPAEEAEQRLKAVFRAAHSLKGAARSVSVHPIEAACHQLEEILAAARDGSRTLGPEHFALLFATADGIEEAGMRLREQQDLSGGPLADLLPRLEAAAAGVPIPPGPARPAAPTLKAAEAPSTGGKRETPLPPPPAAPPPTGEVKGAAPEGRAAAGTVRVPAERLDDLLARAGELLIARRRVEARTRDVADLLTLVGQWQAEWRRAERSFGKLLKEEGPAAGALPPRLAGALRGAGENLRRLEKGLERLTTAMRGDARALGQVAGPLNDAVHRVRMLPFAEACEGLERMARDLAQAEGKEVELVLEGGEVELDRSVLEELKDPLRHLVRNAVAHGAEAPEARRAAGKPPRARVTVTAALRGAQVEVSVTDDGAGLNLEALRARALERGLAEPADERELARLVFLPGLSTSPRVTDVSGRGVGLDVVKNQAEGLHGSADVQTAPGRGTRFTLTVPLTLTTLRAVLVSAGGQTFALADVHVQRVVRLTPDELPRVAGRPMLSLEGGPVPVGLLAAVLGVGGPPEAPTGKAPALVLGAGGRRVALVVDEALAEQEVVVKSLGARVRRLRHVTGATLLASGRVALLLNAAGVVRTALGAAEAGLPARAAAASQAAKKRLLVVDDSVTTRALEKAILEAAGYEVLTAPDGQAAWELLQERGADLLVSDVEMPRLDGVALTEAVRGSPRFRALPVVLVTGRASEQDRARGLQAGADAYLVKSAFDQRALLETVARLL